jgi:predicted RNA binding protein YcfA (HicA-like mRNA interferase family)
VSASKTWQRIARRQYRNISFKDFVQVIEAFGFVHRRTSGSHHIYSNPVVPRPLSLQPMKGEAKPYQIAQFVTMVEEYGLRMRDDE